MKAKIIYIIQKIIFQKLNDNFAIARVQIVDNGGKNPPTTDTVVIGPFQSISENNMFESEGEWRLDSKKGWQFHADYCLLKLAASDMGMIQFLTENIKGLGMKTAKRLVAEFRENTLDIIKMKPEEMLRIRGITEKKKNAIHLSVKNQIDLEDTISQFTQCGFQYDEAYNIYAEYGINAKSKLIENPYQFCKNKKVSFKSADTAAFKNGIAIDDKRRLEQGVLEFLKESAASRGNLFESEIVIRLEIPDLLNKKGRYKEDLSMNYEQAKTLIDKMCLDKKIVVSNRKVYLPYYLTIEEKIVASIVKKRGKINEVQSSDNQIEILLSGMKLDELQKNAVKMAIQNPISIMTGGPGTGKTATIKAIIEILKIFKPGSEVILMAPTGKAAKKMEEATGTKASTIHRAIGLNSLDEEQSQLKEINCELLIIDESSMIDAPLFATLLSLITPNTKLLIVGDAEQLPSVGPGLILRDLIKSKYIPSIRLKTIYRQAAGSNIVTNAYKALSGDKNLELGTDFFFIEAQNKVNVKEIILDAIQATIENGYSLDEIQVLSVMNKGDLGVIELNRAIQAKFNGTRTGKYRVDDRVIHTVNNYELEVFNGETGKVVEILSNGNLIVDFEDRKVEYLPENILELSLAYAITVHKSQGSEFPVILMPFNDSLSAMLNRNIIYTGITRASKRVVLIGDRETFDSGLDKTENMIRNSCIYNRLKDLESKPVNEVIPL